MYSMFKDIWNY